MIFGIVASQSVKRSVVAVLNAVIENIVPVDGFFLIDEFNGPAFSTLQTHISDSGTGWESETEGFNAPSNKFILDGSSFVEIADEDGMFGPVFSLSRASSDASQDLWMEIEFEILALPTSNGGNLFKFGLGDIAELTAEQAIVYEAYFEGAQQRGWRLPELDRSLHPT